MNVYVCVSVCVCVYACVCAYMRTVPLRGEGMLLFSTECNVYEGEGRMEKERKLEMIASCFSCVQLSEEG